MAKTTSIRVNERKTAGKGAARAERRAGLIPGVIYGEKKEPVMFSISALDLDAQMRQKGFWTRQFEIEVGKNKYHAICQDIQTHPLTDRPIHIDFLRVSENAELQIEVPVMYENELACPGLKLGGTLNAIYRAIEVSCKPKDIPETVAQAGAAAVKAIGLLAKDKLMTNPCTAKSDELLCNGCSQCANVCPYGAISYETKLINDHGIREDRRVAVVNSALCQGCGACTVTCPSGAMDLQGFANRQILAEVDAICR